MGDFEFMGGDDHMPETPYQKAVAAVLCGCWTFKWHAHAIELYKEILRLRGMGEGWPFNDGIVGERDRARAERDKLKKELDELRENET